MLSYHGKKIQSTPAPLSFASLTVQIFNYAVSPYDDWHRKAWSAALVLLLLVGLLNVVARFAARSRLQGVR